MFSLASLVDGLAALCPVPGVAARLQPRLLPVLSSASLFISARVYARFLVSLLALPAPLEVLMLCLLPADRSLLLVGSLVTLQLLPFMLLLSRANSRRRRCDAELPFFTMALSVFSHESHPSLQEGLKRIAEVGALAFPAFSREAEIVGRDEAFLPGSPAAVAERAFSNHPSARVRGFVHGFLKTAATGKDIVEYLRQETRLQIERLEQSWGAYSLSVGSLAEVTFILLSLFPVGLEMVGATVPGFTSTSLFALSFGILAVMALVFLALTDSIQPLTHDSPPSPLHLAATIVAWVASTLLCYAGLLSPRVYVAVPLAASLLGFRLTRKHHSRIRRGEEEVAVMLHDLAEESRAGVSLPEVLSSLSKGAKSFASIGGPILAFHQSIRLGLLPSEAQRRVVHPSWLVRVAFGVLAVAFETGAGFEHLEDLSALFRRVSDARKNVSRSMLPFVIIGAVVPVISVSAITFLAGLSQSAPIGLPGLGVRAPQGSLILSVSTVSILSGILLSKLLTQTVRHLVAVPILMASTLLSILVFGVA